MPFDWLIYSQVAVSNSVRKLYQGVRIILILQICFSFKQFLLHFFFAPCIVHEPMHVVIDTYDT